MRGVPRVCWVEEEGGRPRVPLHPAPPYHGGEEEEEEDTPRVRSMADRWRGLSWEEEDHWREGVGEHRSPDNKQQTKH